MRSSSASYGIIMWLKKRMVHKLMATHCCDWYFGISPHDATNFHGFFLSCSLLSSVLQIVIFLPSTDFGVSFSLSVSRFLSLMFAQQQRKRTFYLPSANWIFANMTSMRFGQKNQAKRFSEQCLSVCIKMVRSHIRFCISSRKYCSNIWFSMNAFSFGPKCHVFSINKLNL